jgi:hypothetical protein
VARRHEPGRRTGDRTHGYREASVPTALSVRVVEPGPGRVWRGGQARFADWMAAVPGADTGTLALDLSTTGPEGPWTPLATGLSNNGRHQLVVPAGHDTGDAWVRLRLGAGSAEAVALGGPFVLTP